MKPATFYRIASALLLAFAALHTFGFRQVDPAWHADSVVTPMKSIRFDLVGSSRSYWELYVGFGLLFSVFLVFSAALAWQLGALQNQALIRMRLIAWAFVLCFAAVTILSVEFAFIFPTVLSILVLICLTAAVLSTKSTG